MSFLFMEEGINRREGVYELIQIVVQQWIDVDVSEGTASRILQKRESDQAALWRIEGMYT
jgi:hypothetical protein